VALAGPIASNHSEAFTPPHGERDVLQREERVFPPAGQKVRQVIAQQHLPGMPVKFLDTL
jgi:hypothetical protein